MANQTSAATNSFTTRRKRPTLTPTHVIEQAVKRYLDGGEQVTVLAKYYKVSEPTIYNWIEKAKAQILESTKRAAMSPDSKIASDRTQLALENEHLKDELNKTRNRLVALLIKHGEL